jgi:type IV secretion system protein VirD4
MEALGFIIAFAIIGGIIWLAMNGGIIGIVAKRSAKSAADAQAARLQGTNAARAPLAAPGYAAATTSPTPHAAAAPSRSERLAAINAFYENDLNGVEVRLTDSIPAIVSEKSLTSAAKVMAEKLTVTKELGDAHLIGAFVHAGESAHKIAEATHALRYASFRRTLRDMADGERAMLRLADILAELGQLSATDLQRVKLPIVWNNGSCLITTLEGYNVAAKRAQLAEGLKMVIGGHFGDATSASETVQAALRTALAPDSRLTAAARTTLESYLFSGNRWMAPEAGRTALAPEGQTTTALRLGAFPEGGADMLYDMRESLITVAPPGAGKSQAQVLRNLLYLDAPAVVLDVKGEMLAASLDWRKANVGPCYWFAPGNPERSFRFNPLDFVRADPERAWDDARRLADLLVVPATRGGDDYFEGRARDMITTAVLDVALSEPADRRTMASVLDRLYLSEGDALVAWFDHLDSLGVPQLRRQASALRGMPQKQREGVLDSARRQLEVWQSPALEKLTTASDFDAATLRRENATLYLWVALEDVKKYASVLRVIIGQLVGSLCRAEPESGARPVTFFLDELPRLGRMDVIEEALDVGRGYGVRLWMFCQNLGQLRTAYPNADGMVGNCAARCFMNPDEDTAKWMAENLGVRHGLLDGRRKPLAEPHQLTGPEFAGQIVVFSRGQPPARLDKRPAYADPDCVARMPSASAAQ